MSSDVFDTAAMIRAFIDDEDEQRRWLFMLDNCRYAHGCPCTNTTHVAPRLCGPATGHGYIEATGFVPGRPVSGCALCYGTGACCDRRGRYS